jgi:hypothetical protein
LNIELTRKVLFALAPAAGAAWLAAQSASSLSPPPQPTNPVPDMALTPGAASLTPGPSSGGAIGSTGQTDIYSIPKSAPVGMPSHTTPLAGGSSDAGQPVRASDCAGDGWRKYSVLGFQDQNGCEAKRTGATLTPQAGASMTSGETVTTPSHMTAPSHQPTVHHPVNRARRATPPAEPMMESTPGSSITPLLNPTPGRCEPHAPRD